jgi:DNA primase
MDALTLVNQNLDVERLLHHYDFDGISYEGTYIRACCKIHGGNHNQGFVINTETGLWYCHTGCKSGGDAFTLVQHMEGIPFAESVTWLASFTGVDIDGKVIVERKPTWFKELQAFLKVMGKRKVQHNEYVLELNSAKKLAKYRSFESSTLEHFDVSYVEEVGLISAKGKPFVLRNRLCFPIRFRDINIAYSFRRVRNTDNPKWLHQPASFNAGEVLYNYDESVGADIVVIVEGILDVLAFHELGITAVATFGAHLTSSQLNLIFTAGVSTIVVGFDGDQAGEDGAVKAKSLIGGRATVQRILFGRGDDPETISREELRRLYDKREAF